MFVQHSKVHLRIVLHASVMLVRLTAIVLATQVAELHRLKDLEERSQAGTAVRPLQSSKNQDASLGSSKPSWRNGPSSMTGPSFAPELPRFSGNTEAFSWPALHAANKARPNTQDSRKQARTCSLVKVMSLELQMCSPTLRALFPHTGDIKYLVGLRSMFLSFD